VTSKEGVEWFSTISGLTIGIIFVVTLTVLLFRRVVVKEVRAISNKEDYILLGILMAIGIVGIGHRLFANIGFEELEAVRQFWMNWVALNPTPFPITNPWYVVHCTLAQLIIMYIPFSKLVHVFGNLISTIVEKMEGSG